MASHRPSAVARFGLHAGAAIALAIIPSVLATGRPPWTLAGGQLVTVCALALAYLLAALILEVRRGIGAKSGLWEQVCIGAGTFGILALALLAIKVSVDRSLLLTGVAFAALLGVAQYLSSPRVWKVAVAGSMVLGLGLLGVAQLRPQYLERLSGRSEQARPGPKIVDTAYHTLRFDFHDGLLVRCESSPGKRECDRPRAGGAIAVLGDQYLIVSGDGYFHSVRPASDGARPDAKLLPYRAPLNSSDFVRDFGSQGVERFRVTGMIAEQVGERLRLYVAHHYWNSGEQCVVLRVSGAEVDLTRFLAGSADPHWRTIFDTTPCLPQKGKSFYGDESGGRLALMDDRALLLTVGDFSMDGLTGDKPAAQDPSSSYGKTILIDVETGKGRIYSIGHRNPQGLFVDEVKTVWETEHGPKGGDELNILVEGQNYGWPYVTYGTHALSHDWPLSIKQGEHDGYRMPLFAWVPDIAVGNLVRIHGKQFPRWKGDLLIGSYTRKLWRVKVRDGRVVYVEPIAVRDQNARVRDIVEDAQGRIVLLLDGGSIALVTAVSEEKKVPEGVAGADSMRGQLIFAQCQGCHQVGDGKAHGIGPDLAGIAGRRIAAAEGFTYSAGLSALKGNWTDEKLDRFLSGPQQFASGTSMAFPGIENPSDRARLIGYLKTLKDAK